MRAPAAEQADFLFDAGSEVSNLLRRPPELLCEWHQTQGVQGSSNAVVEYPAYAILHGILVPGADWQLDDLFLYVRKPRGEQVSSGLFRHAYRHARLLHGVVKGVTPLMHIRFGGHGVVV